MRALRFVFLLNCFLLLFATTSNAQMAKTLFFKKHSQFKFIQSSAIHFTNNSGASQTITLSTAPNIGNTLIVAFWAYYSGAVNITPSASDSNGAMTLAINNQINSAASYSTALFYKPINGATTSSITISTGGLAVEMEAVVLEYQGTLTYENSNQITNTNVASSDTSLTTISASPKLLISVYNSTASGVAAPAATNPATLRSSQSNGNTYEVGAVIDQTGLFNNSTNVTNSLTGLNAGTWYGIMSAFK